MSQTPTYWRKKEMSGRGKRPTRRATQQERMESCRSGKPNILPEKAEGWREQQWKPKRQSPLRKWENNLAMVGHTQQRGAPWLRTRSDNCDPSRTTAKTRGSHQHWRGRGIEGTLVLSVFPNFNFMIQWKSGGLRDYGRHEASIDRLLSQALGSLWLPFHSPSFLYICAVLTELTKRCT